MSNAALILQALEQHGQLSAREIAQVTGVRLRLVQGAIGWIRHEKPGTVYRCGWQHESCASRMNLSAIYALGNRADAPRPPSMSAGEKCRRWRAKRRGRVASVFDLPKLMDRRADRM